MKLKYEGNTRDLQDLLLRKKFYLLLRQESMKTDAFDFSLIVITAGCLCKNTLTNPASLFVNKLPAVKSVMSNHSMLNM